MVILIAIYTQLIAFSVLITLVKKSGCQKGIKYANQGAATPDHPPELLLGEKREG